jgi:acyl-CoA dehydrogenase
MVDFTLTEEQENMREMARDFAQKEIRPRAWDYDRDATWPQEIITKAWDVGLMNAHIPQQYGGVGASYLDGCLIGEELAWGCAAIATTLGANELAATPVLLGGSEELKKHYLGMLTEEPKLASFCLTEPDAGSDVSGMRTTAVKQGDKYILNGSKCFITNGGYADWYTVYAKTDKDAGHRGISAFLVPKDGTVTVDKHEDKMGLRASNTATISFNDTEVPEQNLLGQENHGFKLAMMTLDRTRPGVASMAVGIGRAACEFAADYSKQRVQFGVPIAMHQAIQFMIADMATKTEAARLLVWKSAVLLDQDQRNTLVSSHAKRFAADSAMEITVDAVQVYGGYGFMKEYPVEKLMRDAKIMQLYEGTSQIQRLVIARELLLPRPIEEPAVERQPVTESAPMPDVASTAPTRAPSEPLVAVGGAIHSTAAASEDHERWLDEGGNFVE